MATINALSTSNPIEVAKGGTANASFTAYGILAAGTSSTGALQQVSGTGSLNQVLVSQGAGALPQWAAVPATAGVTSLTGTANQVSVSAATGAVTISLPSTVITPGTLASTTTLAAGNLTTAGIVYNSVTTGILTSHQATNHNVQIGNSSGQLADVAPSATSGVALISQGAAADPTFGTVAIAGGGTNATSMTNTFGVNYFDGTSIVTTAVGTATHVLTSNGVGVAPTFQALPAGGVTSITGTANQITASAATGAVTLSIPATFIAPGSIAATTTLTATLGNITATAGDVVINNTAAATTAPFVDFQKSRSGAVITTGDVLGEVAFKGYDSTQYLTSSRIVSTSSGTIAANRIASKLDFYTHPDSTVAATLRATLNAAGGLDVKAPDTGASYTLNLTKNAGNVSLALDGDRFITASDGVNCFVGNENGTVNASGSFNSCFGYQAASGITSGNRNTAIGAWALLGITTGSNNTGIGKPSGAGFPGAGDAYTTESFNIAIGNRGTAGDSGVIRIGNSTDQAKCFIAGTYNIAVGATAGVCIIDSAFQVGTISGTSGQYLQGGTKPAWTTLSGVAVTAIAGTANQITASGSVGSVTLSTPSTFIAPGSIEATTSIKADTIFNTPSTTSTVGQYQINGSAVLHTMGTGNGNIFVGGAGNFTLGNSANNTCMGSAAGAALTTGNDGHCTYIGYQAGTLDTVGGSNTAIGHLALSAFTGTTSSRNVAVGSSSLLLLTTGSRNTGLGTLSGSALTTTDGDNIFIGFNVTGTAGDNNKLQIGKATGTGNGQLNSAFIAGITGITVTGAAVLVSTGDQLGVAVSSRRYKTDIELMGSYSSDILDLEPVTFRYTVGEDQSLQGGLIAEDVYEVMPNLVVLDKEGLPQTVKYHDLPVLLLNEVKKLSSELQTALLRIHELELKVGV